MDDLKYIKNVYRMTYEPKYSGNLYKKYLEKYLEKYGGVKHLKIQKYKFHIKVSFGDLDKPFDFYKSLCLNSSYDIYFLNYLCRFLI